MHGMGAWCVHRLTVGCTMRGIRSLGSCDPWLPLQLQGWACCEVCAAQFTVTFTCLHNIFV